MWGGDLLVVRITCWGWGLGPWGTPRGTYYPVGAVVCFASEGNLPVVGVLRMLTLINSPILGQSYYLLTTYMLGVAIVYDLFITCLPLTTYSFTCYLSPSIYYLFVLAFYLLPISYCLP